MRPGYLFISLFAAASLLLTSCRSEFETVRQSGDAELMLEKAYEYYESSEYLKAKTLFDLVLNFYRGKKEAEKMFYTYAKTHYELGQYVLAAYYYDNFATTYANSEWAEEAEFMAAYCNYLLSPSFRLDQENTIKAIEGFQQFINRHPGSPSVPEANEYIEELRSKLEIKAFSSAMLYYDLDNYQAAMHSFDNLLKQYPDFERAEEVRYLAVQSAFLLAENSIYEKQQERYELTLKKIEEFRKKFPQSEYNKELELIEQKSVNRLKELKNA